MKVAQLWRYPIKSMAGERLQVAELGVEGIPGDRIVHVEDARGRVVTSRSRPRLLLHKGTLGGDGEPLVDGRPWTDPTVAADVVRAAGAGARLIRDETLDRFDVLPLLVATDGAIGALGYDVRRFRPNLLIGGVEGLTERGWEGRSIRIGDAVIRMAQLRQRCIMTTFDPDTTEQDVDVLLRIQDEMEGTLALDSEVSRAGRIAVGDPVELLPVGR